MRWTNAAAGLFVVLPMLLAGQASQNPPMTPPAMPAAPVPSFQPPPRFVVLLDAAHGGNDTGARLTPSLLEKDLTLDLSNRLRSMLAARGMDVTDTRTSDAAMSAVDRAQVANRTPYAVCLILHATATGSGVHLYTSSLGPTPLIKFMPWQTTQSAYVTQSLKLSSDVDSALAHAEIPVTLGRTSLQPMDSFACPAVAIEIAPLQAGASTKASPITESAYQRNILEAVAAALEQWRNDWRQQP